MINTTEDHNWQHTDLALTLNVYQSLADIVDREYPGLPDQTLMQQCDCINLWLNSNYAGSVIKVYKTAEGMVMLDGIRFSDTDQKLRFILERL